MQAANLAKGKVGRERNFLAMAREKAGFSTAPDCRAILLRSKWRP